MKRKRHSPEQIIRKLREADQMLSEGAGLDAVFEVRGAPQHIRSYYGPEFIAKACADGWRSPA